MRKFPETISKFLLKRHEANRPQRVSAFSSICVFAADVHRRAYQLKDIAGGVLKNIKGIAKSRRILDLWKHTAGVTDAGVPWQCTSSFPIEVIRKSIINMRSEPVLHYPAP